MPGVTKSAAALLSPALLIVGSLLLSPVTGPTARSIRIVQPNIGQQDKWDAEFRTSA